MPKQSIGSGLTLVSFLLCVSCNSQQFATITKIANAIIDRASLGTKVENV